MNILIIDTSDNKKIKVGLKINKEEHMMEQEIGAQKAQVVLPFIASLLNKHKLSLKDINNIEVNAGPGSFTGLRVGVSIANVLAFVLKIPVNNKKIGEFVEPVYK